MAATVLHRGELHLSKEEGKKEVGEAQPGSIDGATARNLVKDSPARVKDEGSCCRPKKTISKIRQLLKMRDEIELGETLQGSSGTI